VASRLAPGNNVRVHPGAVASRFNLVIFAVAIVHLMLQLITIPNRCHRFPGYVSQPARFSSDHKSIEITVRQPAADWRPESVRVSGPNVGENGARGRTIASPQAKGLAGRGAEVVDSAGRDRHKPNDSKAAGTLNEDRRCRRDGKGVPARPQRRESQSLRFWPADALTGRQRALIRPSILSLE
jgi:hypothetical protein